MRREYLHIVLAGGLGWLGLILISDAAATADDSHRGMSRRCNDPTPFKWAFGAFLRWPAT
jgi:hypothetical protein